MQLLSAIAPYLLLVASLGIYAIARSMLISVARGPGSGALLLDVLVLVVAAALGFVRYS